MRTLFHNARLVLPGEVVDGALLMEDDKILELFHKTPTLDAQRIDLQGDYLGPGLVDIHVHGGAGEDFVNNCAQNIAKGLDFHLRRGTTSITPACISIPFDQVDKSIFRLRDAAKLTESTVLGFHVEGVYLSPDYRGGHLLEHVHDPDPKEYLPLLERHGDFITEWTLAPELPGALALIRNCHERGVVTSAGHSGASYETLMRAIDAGLTHSTHFACVMSNLQFRALGIPSGRGYAPGLFESILLDERVTTEVIADGYHLHPALIQLAVKCKGFDGVCMVSDSMKGVGLPDGEYIIGDQPCIVTHNLAIIKDRPEVIASSVTPLFDMLRFAVHTCGLPIFGAWRMASHTPAQIIGCVARKGSLAPGKDADLLVVDPDLHLKRVYAMGKNIQL